jgi:GTPase SAR1 family protein
LLTRPFVASLAVLPQAILCYDVSSRKTFENLQKWLAEASQFGVQDNTVFIVVGNKVSGASA